MYSGSEVPATRLQEGAGTAVKSRAFSVRRLLQSEQMLFLLFVLPNFALFGIFSYWPLLYNVYLSVTSWDFLQPVKKFVGLENYRYLVSSSEFREVMLNTVVFTVGGVGGSIALGLLSALLLNQKLRFRNGVRAVVFAPTLLSGVAISIVWYYIFDPRVGLLRTVLGWVGIDPIPWLREPNWAMAAVIIVYVWKNLGMATVIYLAGLQGIPKDLYEAAKVDGANALGRFRAVTWPMLAPIHFFVLITAILGTLQSFDIIRTLTNGGPVNATSNLIYYIYEQSFINNNAGRGAASAMVLFAIMLVVTLLQYRFSERRSQDV